MIDQVDQVKDRSDIAEIIGGYVQLKSAGRNMKGLCPFHGEKTPSFMVNPERGTWKCFGCGEGGDVFTFLEKIEGLDFAEALEKLAKRAGIVLEKKFSGQKDKQKETLLAINEAAKDFYHKILLTHPVAQKSREYLKDRGLKVDDIKTFELGYAPNSWDSLFNMLVKKGFSQADIAMSGLVISKDRGGFYDRFRGRVMFPIRDIAERLVGFSGRTMMNDPKEAKYVNTPETPMFSKRNLLYGIHLSRQFVTKENSVVLVEGQFDMVSSFLAGTKNVVATGGTALTDGQLRVIKRLTENVLICFDSDSAGDAASRRGIEMAENAGLVVKVVTLVGVKDPDEMVRTNLAGWKEAIKNAQGVYDYYIDWAFRSYDRTTSEGKRKIGQELMPVLMGISDEIVKNHYVKIVADRLDTTEDVIMRSMSQVKSKSLDSLTDFSKVDDLANKKIDDDIVNHKAGLEEYFLAHLLQIGDYSCELSIWPEVGDINDTELKQIYQALIEYEPFRSAGKFKRVEDKNEYFNQSRFISNLPEELVIRADKLCLLDLSEVIDEPHAFGNSLEKSAIKLCTLALKTNLDTITRQLKELDASGGVKDLAIQSRKFARLSKKLRSMQKS